MEFVGERLDFLKRCKVELSRLAQSLASCRCCCCLLTIVSQPSETEKETEKCIDFITAAQGAIILPKKSIFPVNRSLL